jgi:hypothetical protein
MENKEQKPLILEIDEAKKELTQCVNYIMQEHGLPCYLVDMLLSNIAAQIKEGAKNELAMLKAQIGAATAAP